MSIVRRIGLAAVVVLGLSLPVSATPADAHTPGGWGLEWGFRSGAGGTVVAGLVTNHTNSRQKDINVTAVWRVGDTVVASETTTAFIDNLAVHSASPFKLVETEPVAGATLTVSASGTATLIWPNAPLGIDPGTISVDTYTGVVHNDSEVTAENVRVFAVRRLGGIIVDAAASASISSIPAFASAAYTIEFDDFYGDSVGSLSAESGGGTYVHTSWNNWFNDLGTSNFAEEIAFLADEGITFGCGVLRFCPKSPVTREQMAVFLDRALDLPTATGDHPFTDIGERPEYAQQAIANVYEAGIAGGCTATTFCPIAPVTRGQMSKFIVLGYELTPIAGPGPFSDDNGHFSEPYNNRMAADGITSGCTATTFCPLASVLREQMAKFLFEAEN
jgi:hypothetical protein